MQAVSDTKVITKIKKQNFNQPENYEKKKRKEKRSNRHPFARGKKNWFFVLKFQETKLKKKPCSQYQLGNQD